MASRSAWPLMARITSPGWSPALAAGVRRRTAATTTPSGAAPLSSEQRALMSLVLRVVRGVEEAHALEQVLKSRHDREDGRQPHDRPRRQYHVEIPREQSGQHREDLKERRRLPGPRRPGVDAPTDHEHQEGADDQQRVPRQYHRGDPEG